MDLLKAYDSDGFCSKESENDILESQEEELDSRAVRQVYLIDNVQPCRSRQIPNKRVFCAGGIVFFQLHTSESCSVVLLPGKTRSNRNSLSHSDQIKQKSKMAPEQEIIA